MRLLIIAIAVVWIALAVCDIASDFHKFIQEQQQCHAASSAEKK